MSVDPAVVKDWLLPVIEAGASTATIILVLLVRSQMKQTDKQLRMTQDQVTMTKHEMENTIRPWIGCQDITPLEENEIRLRLHNFGSLPTLSMDSKTVATTDPVTLETILASKFAREDVGVILPNQDYIHFIDLDAKLYALARQGKVPMQLGFLLNYEYAENKVGQYGFIAKYNHEKNVFIFIREWAKPITVDRQRS